MWRRACRCTVAAEGIRVCTDLRSFRWVEGFGSTRALHVDAGRPGSFRSLVEADGQPAPLLDLVDAAFHRLALPVEIGVMADRAAAARAALLAVGCLVAFLGDDGHNAALAQVEVIGAGGVCLIGGHRGRASTRAPHAQADLDPGQHGAKLRTVAGLPRGQDEGQRTASPVGRQMDLAGQSAP